MLESHPAELSIDTFVGWRVWAITAPRAWEDAGGPVLRGAWGRVWPGPQLEARCLRPPIETSSFSALLDGLERDEHTEPAPYPPCSCGIYARRPDGSDDLWVTRIDHLPKAGGFIEMSGLVIEGSKGYRAQRATVVGPLEVSVPCADCGDDAVRVATRDGNFRGSCRRHAVADADTTIGDWTAAIVPLLGRRYEVPILEGDRR